MDFLERVVKGAEYRATTGLANPARWLIDSLGGQASYSGKKVTIDNSLSLSAVFSAVEKISEIVGSLPLKVYRITDDDERVEARTHRTWRMLHDMPNSVTTAHRFWSTVVAQMLLWGNAYILKERSGGFLDEVESLWLLDPAVVQLVWNGREKKFVIEGPPRKSYTVDQVLHIPAFSLDGIYGCSRISYCRQTLGTALARAEFEGSFYRQGARIPGVIEHPGTLKEAGTRNLAEQFGRWHGGSGDKHKVPVLEEGAHFQGISMPLSDMQFVEQQQLSMTEIAVLFGLPPGELGGMHGGSLEYATEEMNQIRFSRMLWPLTDTIAKAVSSDPAILPQNVFFAEFVIEAMMKPDSKSQAEWWEKMKGVLNLDPAYIASRLNIPKSALMKPEPVPVAPQVGPDGQPLPPAPNGGGIPPKMAAMQNALKAASSANP